MTGKWPKFISHSFQNYGANMVKFWWEDSFGLQTANMFFPLMAESTEKKQALLWLLKTLIPFMMAPPSWPYLILTTSQKSHLLMWSHSQSGKKEHLFTDSNKQSLFTIKIKNKIIQNCTYQFIFQYDFLLVIKNLPANKSPGQTASQLNSTKNLEKS